MDTASATSFEESSCSWQARSDSHSPYDAMVSFTNTEVSVMAFNILEYLTEVEEAAGKLPASHQLAFVLWCAGPLLEAAKDYLESRLGSERGGRLPELSKMVWLCATSEIALDTTNVVEVRHELEWLDWGDDVPQSAEVADDAALEAIECLIRAYEILESPSGKSCAEAAERVINHLDFRLDWQGSDDPGEEVAMKVELDSQRRMLAFLATGAPLTDGTLRMFRGRSDDSGGADVI